MLFANFDCLVIIRLVHDYQAFILARFSLVIIVVVDDFLNKNHLLYFFKKMRVENHTYSYIRHIMLNHYEKGWNAAQSFRDLNELFGDHTTLPSYSGPFGNPLGETPVETQIFFLLTFLNRSHDSSPVTRFFRNGVCTFPCSKSGKIQTRSALCSRRVRGDPSSQIPYFSELFETANDGRMIHIRPAFWLSSFRPLPRLSKVPDRRNLKVDLFIFHLQGLYRPI